MIDTYYGIFRQRKFTDVFPDEATFTAFVTSSTLSPITSAVPYNGGMRLQDLSTLYYLLYARYGNSTISSTDENQFKYKMLAIISEAGPAWATKRYLNNQMMQVSLDEIKAGALVIQNNASHDGSTPSTSTLTELKGIDVQNTSRRIQSDYEALANKFSAIENDVTSTFLGRFSKLFLAVVAPDAPLLYEEV